MTRMEELLTALVNGETVSFEPQSRMEKYLKNCCDKCGCDGLPPPTSRGEVLLAQLAEQLKNGGGGTSGATAYTVSSVKELPSNAVDGSMAIVPSDSIVGEWEFHETLTIDIFSEISAVYGENYADEFALTINDEMQELELGCMCAGSRTYIYPYDNGVWLEGVSRRFRFLKDTDDENFKNFLKVDAQRLSGGYSLYTHENGQWVYKCEVV